MMKIQRVLVLSLLLTLLTSAFGTLPRAHAATLTVNTLTDESDGSCTDGDCSLRDAIAVAKAGDTITFSVTGTIVLSWYLTIGKDLTISGPGADRLTISGNHASRVFRILNGARVTLSGVRIADGHEQVMGGGIDLYDGTLTVNHCTLSGNSASSGGGIQNHGNTLTVINSFFSGNSAVTGGAIDEWVGSTLAVTNTIFSGNSATANGGAIYNNGPLTVADSTFTDNTAATWGGGIEIFEGPVTVTNSTFSGNSAGQQGGGIDNWGALTVAGCTFSGNSSGHGGGLATFDPVTVTGSTFSGNSASQSGGGIHSSQALTVINSTFTANSANGEGGGIHGGGTLVVTNSTFSGNGASDGGGVWGIGTVTVKNTIIADSTAGGDCSEYLYFTAASSNNLATDDSCSSAFTQVSSGDLHLDWRGRFFALLSDSVAIDTGTNSGCPATDQRGWLRPQDGDGDGTPICDVGSYEFAGQTHSLYLPLIRKQ